MKGWVVFVAVLIVLCLGIALRRQSNSYELLSRVAEYLNIA